GIAGIGKSRLVNEFRKKLIPVGSSKNIFIKELLSPKQETEYNWFYFPCDQILQTSFNPIIHFLKEYFDQSEKSSIKKNKDNFEKKFRMLIERVGDRSIKHELRRTKTILGSMINLYWKDSLYEQLDSKGRYQNVLYSFKNLIKAESTNKPTILEFEDCHWIDSDSRKMLETLTANVGDLPFVIISTCRIKDDGTKFNFNFKNIIENEIFLDSLPEKSSRDLISNILGGKISNRLFETIRSKSEGNPFYIEQILLYMQDNNLLEKEDTLIDIVSQIYSENLKIPSTINSIIIARIDKLTVELKELIKTASVLGREFVINVLVTMLRNKQISETLEEGIDENIWSSLSELLYIFKHSLIRETAYQMQLKKNLRKLHKIAAETIEELYRESLENHYTELADHYEKAEVPERAVDYLFKAGKQAKENYLNELAIDLLDRLLKNLKQLSNSEILEIDTLILQGDVLKLIGKWDLAEANFIRAQELSNKIKDKTRLGRSLLNLAEHYEKKGFYQDAMDYSNRCLELSQKINDHRGIAVAYCCIGSILTKKDEYAEAIKCFKKSLKNTRKSNNKKELNNILQSYGILLKKTGDYSKASEIYKRRIRISTEIGDEKALAYTLNNLGNIQTDQGEYDESEASFKKALEILTKLGDIYAIGMIIGNLGIIYMSQGKYEKSLKYFLKAISISREINDKVGIAINYGNAGIVYNRIGKNKKALECYKVRLEINHELGDRSGTALAHGNIGNVYIDSGKFIEANRSYEKMLSISKEIGFKIGIYYALANLAGGFAAMKEHDKSLRFFDEAIILGKELDLKDHLSQDLINKAELLFSLQKYSEAKLIVEEARKLTEKVMVDELIFKVMLLSAKIDFYSNNNLKKQKEIIETLRSYSENSEDQKEIAESNFELGNFCEHLDQIDDSIKHCKIAKDKYVILYKKTKYYKFKVKINFLDEKLKNR
ncbi:MAG: tetratricopeptide repeat protein, partial [Candidatus Cloacimonetes bacterium]|nr:tetratricopeptide repeat protein [Candidatus Cloacimonadota bacterium]